MKPKTRGMFTHFKEVFAAMSEDQQKVVTPNSIDLFHVTLSMLILPTEKARQLACETISSIGQQLSGVLGGEGGVELDLKGLGCFRKPHKLHPGSDEYDELSLIYVDLTANEELYKRLEEACNIIIREFLKNEIIHEDDFKSMNITFKHGKFKPEKMHITLFRVHQQSFKNDSGQFVKHNWRNIYEKFASIDIGRVLVPCIDISTRFFYDEKDLFFTSLCRVPIPRTKPMIDPISPC